MRILIVQGHPDPAGNRFLHALAAAYVEGAREQGHDVRVIDVARIEFPLLQTKADYETGAPPTAIRRAQRSIEWAEHIVFFFPLWLGTLPAALKGFLEQVFRPGFAMDTSGKKWRRLLTGRSARVVVTMDMPEAVYRWFFLAHGVRSLERNVLKFVGIKPVRETLIGGVAALGRAECEQWLAKLRELGERGR